MEQQISASHKVIQENNRTTKSFLEKYRWQVSNVKVYKKLIETKGHLSLWEYEMQI